MKKLLPFLFSMFICILGANAQCGDLHIAGVIDGPRTGGTPKAIQLCATAAIPDLSIFGISSANNGAGTTTAPEFIFPTDALNAGDCIWIASESPEFTAFFGFAPCYESGAANINGDDAVELFCNGAVTDVFGEVDCDPNAGGDPECIEPSWEYTNGWASGQNSTLGTFSSADWTFSGVGALSGTTATNADVGTPYPNAVSNCPVPIACDANEGTFPSSVGGGSSN